MATVISCNSCQRSFAFKPELAGKRVKCKCGGRVQFPAAPEDDVLDDFEVIEDLPPAEESLPTCNGCGAQLQPGAVLCTACGHNQRTGQRMSTQVVRAPKPSPPPRKVAADTPSGGGSSSSGFGTMIVGGAICAIGIVVTVGTYNMATQNGGGRYLVAYGPIIFGGLTFLKGLFRTLTGD